MLNAKLIVCERPVSAVKLCEVNRIKKRRAIVLRFFVYSFEISPVISIFK